MRTATITLYTFAELNEKARERVRQEHREAVTTFFAEDNADAIMEDFKAIAPILGVTLKQSRGAKPEALIAWSGFSSQGDGASFEGSYAFNPEAEAKIREYAPEDEELHRIAAELAAANAPKAGPLTATLERSSHQYPHPRTIRIIVYNYADEECGGPSADRVSEALYDLMAWLYRQLEREYEYRMSDESIDEDITANEAEGGTFLADGRYPRPVQP